MNESHLLPFLDLIWLAAVAAPAVKLGKRLLEAAGVLQNLDLALAGFDQE